MTIKSLNMEKGKEALDALFDYCEHALFMENPPHSIPVPFRLIWALRESVSWEPNEKVTED